MSNTRRSRVPDIPNLDQSHQQFLDGIDRRQMRLAELQDLDPAATSADIIEKINAILATHRTR